MSTFARMTLSLALPLYTSAFALAARASRRTRLLHMQAGQPFPSSNRWDQYIVSTTSERPKMPVLVLEKDEYDGWMESQSEEQRAFLAMAGLSEFKDDGLILLPERRWAFLTKNASSLFAFSSLPSRLPKDAVYELQSSSPLPATAALSWGLGCYSFDACKGATTRRKADGKPKFASLVLPQACDGDATAAALRGTYLCRDLINTPAADMGPAQMEAVTRELASKFASARVSTVEGPALLEGYPQVHAVGRAAGELRQPRLIDLVWGDEDAPRVTLVGKGVCFDTGGLDIKPPAAMLTMKKDMGGAAHVLGLASMIMDTGLPIRLRVLIPAVENSISGDAFRPGDVLVARNGKTTEIGNTDAEGRLVLADALVEACADSPQLLVDCATLTGASRVALGTDVPSVFCNDQGVEYAEQLVSLSATEQDQVWRLPLWQGYREQIDSKVADLKNIGAGPYGGAITAALYLAEFVEPPSRNKQEDGDAEQQEESVVDGGEAEAPPWLHLDIMAYNTGSKPGRPEGGEAMGMRALFKLIEARYGDK